MTQQHLFDAECSATATTDDYREFASCPGHESVTPACLDEETDALLSQTGDGDGAQLLVALAQRLARTVDHVERALVAMQMRNSAELVIDANLRQANRNGSTWRDIGARTGIPFQTLHRRYGGK